MRIALVVFGMSISFAFGAVVGFHQAPELSESPCCNRPPICPGATQWQTDALDVCQMILRHSLATSNACIKSLESAREKGGGL